MDSKNNIYTLIKTGVPDNITLAFQLMKSNNIELDFSKEQELYEWAYQEYDEYQEYSFFDRGESTQKKLSRLYSAKKLLILTEQRFSISENIGLLTNLKYFNIAHNFITELPPSFAQLSSLEKLNINSNRLEKIPEEIFQLSNLEVLSLRSTALKEISPNVTKLKKLKELSLNYNKIENIPIPILDYFNSLTNVYLSNNPLSTRCKELIKERITDCRVSF